AHRPHRCGNARALARRRDTHAPSLRRARSARIRRRPRGRRALRARRSAGAGDGPIRGNARGAHRADRSCRGARRDDGVMAYPSVLAGRAVGEARALTDRAVRALDGGNATWRAAGHVLTAEEPRMADEAVDVWLKPYERAREQTAAMREYLSWEVDLPARIARDGSANFMRFGA